MSQYETPARSAVSETPAEQRILRFPHLLGGSRAFRSLPAAQRLEHLCGAARTLSFEPAVPVRRRPFDIRIAPASRDQATITLVRLEIRFPSGAIRKLDYVPEAGQTSLSIGPFQSDAAGDLYVSARIYFSDGSVENDARVAVVLSLNPDQLVITPLAWLVSGRYGQAEYDWDKNEFHCRAYATITNGSEVPRIFRRCDVAVTDGGVGGTLITAFSFDAGPFTVNAGESIYLTVDTWYPPGNSVNDKFNQKWDLTVQFTFVADGDVRISDFAAYRPMATVLTNMIATKEFSDALANAEGAAVAIASEILEQQDLTLYGPYWRILTNQADRDRFSIIDVGWTSGKHDYAEAHDMYQNISGPESDRLDVFLPVAFAYKPEVPEDERNVLGASIVKGPFPKDAEPRRSGCLVLADESDVEYFGIAIAHEMCHYLGLSHVEDAPQNLMDPYGGVEPHELTREQWDTIRKHGMMKWLAADI